MVVDSDHAENRSAHDFEVPRPMQEHFPNDRNLNRFGLFGIQHKPEFLALLPKHKQNRTSSVCGSDEVANMVCDLHMQTEHGWFEVCVSIVWNFETHLA